MLREKNISINRRVEFFLSFVFNQKGKCLGKWEMTICLGQSIRKTNSEMSDKDSKNLTYFVELSTDFLSTIFKFSIVDSL